MEIVITIVEEIADREDTEPTELTPLAEVISPYALQSFMDVPSAETLSIGFFYCGYVVTVSNDGTIEVESITDEQRQKM